MNVLGLKDKHYITLTLWIANLLALFLCVMFFFLGFSERTYEAGEWLTGFFIYSSFCQLALILLMAFKLRLAFYLYCGVMIVTQIVYLNYSALFHWLVIFLSILILFCLWSIFSEWKKYKSKKADKIT